MHFVDVGFSNFVEAKKIIGVSRPDSSPTRRMINLAKEEGRYVDYTQGKKTRSIILTPCGDDVIVMASALLTSTVITRINRIKGTKVVEAVSEEIIEVTSE
jgi:extracellular matrix regulatory protein A